MEKRIFLLTLNTPSPLYFFRRNRIVRQYVGPRSPLKYEFTMLWETKV